jgi:kinesin family protein 3/17
MYATLPQVNAEVEDMYKEFQREKEDLLESIRMLQDQMQLKVRSGKRGSVSKSRGG